MKKYRPANGTEGAIFIDSFCGNCVHDKAFRDGDGDSCPIVANSLMFDIHEDEYPVEWVYGEDGYPTCTAFEDENVNVRCKHTVEMF